MDGMLTLLCGFKEGLYMVIKEKQAKPPST